MSHRDALLDGALRCLQEKGYARTTTRDIVAASGTNLGSIVYHFGTKERLLNEAISEGFRRWTAHVATLSAAGPEDEPLGERLRRAFEALLATIDENRGLFAAFAEALAQAERSEDVRRDLAASYEAAREAIGSLAAEAAAPVEIDGRGIASLLLALADGLTIQHLVDPERAPDIDQLMASAARGMPLVADVGGRPR